MRAYLRFDRRESRLPAAIAIVVVAVLYPLIPSQLSLGPAILFPIIAVLGVLPLTIADALGLGRPWERPLALTPARPAGRLQFHLDRGGWCTS